MALTPEEQAQLEALTQKSKEETQPQMPAHSSATEIAKEMLRLQEESKKPTGSSPVTPAKSFGESVAEQVEKEKLEKETLKKSEAAIKFNTTFESLLEDSSSALFGDAQYVDTFRKLLNESATREESEIGKAQVRARALLDRFVEVQDNLDILPNVTKQKANEWVAMSDDSKRKNSIKYFDEVLGVAIDISKNMNKEAALKMKNGAVGGTSSIQKRIVENSRKVEFK